MFSYLVHPQVVQPDDACEMVVAYHSHANDVETNGPVIERSMNVLTREEALQNADACKAAMIKELNRWIKHGAESRNLLKSKWVLKWKMIDGSKDVKGRLVAQGFQDHQSISTFSGTTSRWGQRIIIALATQSGWPLYSTDVSEAFLRGITFEELSKEDSTQPLRVVEIALPTGTEELLQSFPGYESYNSGTECLSLLKPGFGLKDAPRLWNAALQRVLRKCGLCAVQTDRQYPTVVCEA